MREKEKSKAERGKTKREEGSLMKKLMGSKTKQKNSFIKVRAQKQKVYPRKDYLLEPVISQIRMIRSVIILREMIGLLGK